MSKVTLGQVAAEAGVSLTVAAKVISRNNSNVRVSPEKAERIREVAARLNYRPNFNAQRLAGRSSRVIGILIETNAAETHFRTLGRIEHFASQQGYRCMIGEFGKDPRLQREQYDIFMQHGVDGVICMPSDYLDDSPDFTRKFADACRNTVFIDTPPIPQAACVHVDRRSVIYELVCHLYEQGARRIAQVRGNQPYRTSLERLEGYRDGMRQCGFAENEMNVIEIDAHFTAAETRADCDMLIRDHILPKKLDALLLSNDLYAIAMLNRLQAAGLRVPNDIRVAGYNNNDYSLCTTPELTTVDDKTEEQARLIVDLLLRKLEDRENELHGEIHTIKPELIIRQSTRRE